jgi:hypothetical protein
VAHETEQDRIEMEEFLAQPFLEVVIKERNALRERCAYLEAEIARLERLSHG